MATNPEARAQLEREFLQALAKLPQPVRDVAAERFADLLQLAVESERMRCANVCRARTQLWRTTRMASHDSPRSAIEEARARANEAEFLADALEAPPNAAEE